MYLENFWSEHDRLLVFHVIFCGGKQNSSLWINMYVQFNKTLICHLPNPKSPSSSTNIPTTPVPVQFSKASPQGSVSLFNTNSIDALCFLLYCKATISSVPSGASKALPKFQAGYQYTMVFFRLTGTAPTYKTVG